MSEFFQQPPRLGNQWDEDVVLRRTLERLLPPATLGELEAGLRELGGRAVGEIAAMGELAEAEPPRLVRYEPWGRRVDRIEVSRGWRRLHAIAAREGIVACAYERPHGAWSRLEQFARLYLFHPSSAVASCPLAMTDGAARVLELHGPPAIRERLLPRLTSRDPERFWTSGQWMTERAGGSDVSRTATVARAEGDAWRLTGSKWFTSATTSEIALTLGRIDGDPEGSRWLSLFLLELRDERGEPNGIRIRRLKEKLGTRALPTAELELDGTRAVLIGERGAGVRTIATMLNITRVYNGCCAVAGMRRGLALARDYANRRQVFGRPLSEQPLHLATLADLEADFEAALQLVAHCFLLLGREECGEADEDERARLRILTPLAKLWTGKLAVESASEVLECFGGAGYVEDTGLPRLLRDAQVLPIWEGTTNVLALDVLRALEGAGGISGLAADLTRRLEALGSAVSEAIVSVLRENLDELGGWLHGARADRARLESGARRLAMRLAAVVAAVDLLEQAAWEAEQGDGERARAACERFVARRLDGRPWLRRDPAADRLLALV